MWVVLEEGGLAVGRRATVTKLLSVAMPPPRAQAVVRHVGPNTGRAF